MENTNTQLPMQRLSKAQIATGVAAFILLILSVILGFSSGIARANSLNTYNSVDSLNTALSYYFKDQNEYPTAEQFQNQQILTLNYLSSQPKPSDAAGVCSGKTDFSYTRPSTQTFQLQFCLQQGVNGLGAGEHTLTDSGVR